MGFRRKKNAQQCGEEIKNGPDEATPDNRGSIVQSCENSWIGVKVKNEEGQSVKNVTVRIRDGNGTVHQVDLGSARLIRGVYKTPKNLPKGSAHLSFPDLYDVEWWPEGKALLEKQAGRSAIIKEGDCVSRIAAEKGFRNPDTIIDLSENDALWVDCPNPNQITVGKALVYYADKGKAVERANEQVWTFVVRTAKKTGLRIVLLDKNDTPLPQKAWTLKIGDKTFSGKTKKDGLIEVDDIDPTARSGSLKVTMIKSHQTKKKKSAAKPGKAAYPPAILPEHFEDREPDNPHVGLISRILTAVGIQGDEGLMAWNLEIGSLPPYQEDEGVQARLHNLGFGCKKGDDGQASERAVKAFQRIYFNQKEGSGKLQDITEKIKNLHDEAM